MSALRPPAPPPPPPGRKVRGWDTGEGAAPALSSILIGVIVLTIALFAVHYLVPAPAVQTSALSAECRLPSEGETLLITVNVRENRVQTRCVFVAPRGGYLREKKK